MSTETILFPFKVVIHKHAVSRRKVGNYLHILLIVLGAIAPIAYVFERMHSMSQNELFKTAISAAEAGRWVWYIEKNEVQWDDQMFKVFGKDPTKWTPNYEGFSSCVVMEDRDLVKAEIYRALRERGAYQAVFKIITDTGDVRMIRAAGKVSEDGKYMTGICLRALSNNGSSIIPVDTQTSLVNPLIIKNLDAIQ